MKSALERASNDGLRVVPVVVEPCDWQGTPLAKFKALPKDGKAISLWTNENMAMLDVATELRRILEAPRVPTADEAPYRTGLESPRRRVRVKREFDPIDRADYRDAAFAEIRRYFESSCNELNQIGDPLKARFAPIDGTAFTCTVVNRAVRNGEAHITVHNQRARSLGDITFSFAAFADRGSANGMIDVDADEFELFLRFRDFGFQATSPDKKLTADRAARLLWDRFMENAGVEYE